MEGDLVYISASEENAAEIVKLNGFSFAGATLEVAVHEGGWPQETGLSPSSQETKAQLQHILSLRYDGSQKLLNLSHLDQDPGLIAMGMFQEKVVPEKLFAAIMAVCDGLFTSRQAKREAIESITLAGNSIDNVSQIMPLADTFPDLKNLDLSNNNIQDIKGLARWRNRLPRLEALLMMGNPIETNEPNYKMEVINWFPRLVNFNGVTVRTPEDVARAEEARKPHAIPHSGTSFRDVNGIGASFIMEFFPAYDTDRANLAAKFYDDESTFSLSVVTQIPKRPHGAVASWASYLKFSRNLTKVTSLPARVQRLFTGTALIQTVWKGLPATRHPSLTSETHKYLVDCQPMLGLPDPTGQSIAGVDGLAINMHGEFDEIDPQTGKQGKRSFSRSFILGPGKPGQQLIRVINDMLTIRAWTPLPNVNAPTPTGSPVDIRKQMIIELSQRTNMTLEYAELCLVGANWDFDTAMAMFNEKRVSLQFSIHGNSRQRADQIV